MQVISDKPQVEAPTQSRLPAGSTMLLPNGIRVAHPHGEANLAGAGDGHLSPEAVSENLDDLKFTDVTAEIDGSSPTVAVATTTK